MTNDIRYSGLGYPMATQNVDGTWHFPAPDSQSAGTWGHLRIEVDATWDTYGTAYAANNNMAVKTAAGTDISLISGVPTIIDSLSFGEPYGETTGQITLPRLTPLDAPAWLRAGANVDVWRVLPAALAAAAGTAEVPYWHGVVASIEVADGEGISSAVSLQLMGALYGEASVRAHQPLMLDTVNDVGTWAGRALDPALYSRPIPFFTRFSFESTTTGIDVRFRGSRGQSVIDYMDELLALAQDDNQQWTVARANQQLGAATYPRARHYYLRPKQAAMTSVTNLFDDYAENLTWATYHLWPNNDPYSSGTAEADATYSLSSAVTDVSAQSLKVEFPANTDMTANVYIDLSSVALDPDKQYTVAVRVYVVGGGANAALTFVDGYPSTPFMAISSVTDQWTTLSCTASGSLLMGTYAPSNWYLTVERDDWTVATTIYVDGITVGEGIDIQQNTVFAGGYGVALSLTQDVTEQFTSVYGEGVHPVDDSDLSGSRWRNAVFPSLAGTVPTYPTRTAGSTYPITVGDGDGDFSNSYGVITALNAQLRAGGWPGATIGTAFTAATGTAINALKTDIAWTNTTSTVQGTADWAMIFGDNASATGDLASGYFQPLAADAAVVPYKYTAFGEVIGTAPSFDPRVLRVDNTVSYGDNVPKRLARVNARRKIADAVGKWTGTITLAYDPTDENGTGRSRLDIEPGGWIQVNNLNGGTYRQFYIAGVTHSDEGLSTTLTVSQTPYDLLELSARLERNRVAKENPARSFYSQRTKTVRPFRSVTGWDVESGAGLIRPTAAAATTWTTGIVLGSQYGSIGSLHIDFKPATGYCFALFGGSVNAASLGSLISAPLGSVTGEYSSWWEHPDKIDTLNSWGFIEAWGSNGEAAGYYPGAQSKGTASAGTVTGVLEDAASVQFASLEPPWLWWAIWPNAAGTVSGQMRIVLDEG